MKTQNQTGRPGASELLHQILADVETLALSTVEWQEIRGGNQGTRSCKIAKAMVRTLDFILSVGVSHCMFLSGVEMSICIFERLLCLRDCSRRQR